MAEKNFKKKVQDISSLKEENEMLEQIDKILKSFNLPFSKLAELFELKEWKLLDRYDMNVVRHYKIVIKLYKQLYYLACFYNLKTKNIDKSPETNNINYDRREFLRSEMQQFMRTKFGVDPDEIYTKTKLLENFKDKVRKIYFNKSHLEKNLMKQNYLKILCLI